MLVKFTVFLLFVAASTSLREPSPEIIPIPGGLSGEAITTRYWDCCGGSCNWDAIVHTTNGFPVRSCEIDGVTNSTKENNGNSVCNPNQGNSFTCSNQQPIVINSTLSYGFAAVSFVGSTDVTHCCECYLLSFKDQLAGKQFLVQTVNTGSDLVSNQFDLQLPGGGVGIFNIGCKVQWNAPEDGWGDRYGGVQTIEGCNALPAQLQDGCRWRFEFLEGVSNPAVTFKQVKCPLEIIAITNCGSIDYTHCCECYLLKFQGELSGKQLLVQTINTGSDLVSNQFDIQIPGGGVGLGNIGCQVQWNASENGWGDRYGGVHTIEECNELPEVLQEGCRWRFLWMEGVSNPGVTYTQVKCPLELIAITNCGDFD